MYLCRKEIMKDRYLLLLLMLLFFTGGCDPETAEDDTPVVTLRADKTEVATYEFVSATIEPNTLKSESYHATIGGESIVIAAEKEKGKLSILIPDIAPGKQTLSVNLDGREFSVDFVVQATTIADRPDEVIAKAVEDITFDDDELDAVHGKMKGLEGTEFLEENTAIIKQLSRLLSQTLGALDSDQKKQFASIIIANPLLFSSEEDPVTYMDELSFRIQQESPEESLDILFARMERDKKKLLAIGALAAWAGLTGQPWLSAGLGVVGILKIYQLNNYNIAGLDRALVRFGDMLIDDMESGRALSKVTIYKDKKYLVKVRSNYRNPSSLEMNSSEVLMKGIIAVLDEVGDVWITANKVVSRLGYPLKGNAFHIKNVTSKKSKTLDVRPKYLAITNISNPKVDWEIGLTTDGWVLEFTTEEITPQDFTFDIVYKQGTEEESVLKYDVTLDPSSHMFGWYVGFYYLWRPNGTGVECSPKSGEKGEVFFYFTSTKMVTYTKSILPEIPNLLLKNEGRGYPVQAYMSESFHFQHLAYTEGEERYIFGMEQLNINPGIEISSHINGGLAYATVAGQGCDRLGTRFSYDVGTEASYYGEDPPANLTQAEIQKILDL
jgi:hypothetical protein